VQQPGTRQPSVAHCSPAATPGSLAARDPAAALAAVEEHARLFHGAGLLAEKREELRTLALLAAGRNRR
jgi:hypothetical protein